MQIAKVWFDMTIVKCESGKIKMADVAAHSDRFTKAGARLWPLL